MTGVLDLAVNMVTNPMQITKPKGLYEKEIITALGVNVVTGAIGSSCESFGFGLKDL